MGGRPQGRNLPPFRGTPQTPIHIPNLPSTKGYILNRAGVPKGAIVTALDGSPTPDLEAFAAALRRQVGLIRGSASRTLKSAVG